MSLKIDIRLPQSPDALGRWLEENGASIEIGCSLGQFSVTVTRRRLHSFGAVFCEAMRASGMPLA